MITCGYQLVLSTSTDIKFHLDIHSLKEMMLLPLLYPEVFQQFSITPHSVLFHGSPGTGKTLPWLPAVTQTGNKYVRLHPYPPLKPF